MCSFLDEIDSFGPIHHTISLFLSELDLPIDWLVVIDVVEIQARISTHTAQILNFLSPIFSSPYQIRLQPIYSELHSLPELPLELVIQEIHEDFLPISQLGTFRVSLFPRNMDPSTPTTDEVSRNRFF